MTERKDSSFDRFDKWWQAVVEPFFKKWGNLTLLTVFGFAAFIWVGRANDLKTSDWSSWVQAIGSIIALAVAVALPAHDRALRRREEKQKSLEQAVIRKGRIYNLATSMHAYALQCVVAIELTNGFSTVSQAMLSDFHHQMTDLENAGIDLADSLLIALMRSTLLGLSNALLVPIGSDEESKIAMICLMNTHLDCSNDVKKRAFDAVSAAVRAKKANGVRL